MHIRNPKLARLLTIAGAALFAVSTAHSQATASGTLQVTATVTSSLQLLFAKATGGPSLSGNNTSAATLAFGSISAYGSEPTGVTLVTSSDTTHTPCSSGTPCFVVSAPVNVIVDQYNGSSTKFTLTAQLATADTTNFWAVGSEANAVTNTAATPIVSAAGTYGATGNLETVYLGIPTTSTTSISNTLDFTVTAN